MVSSYFTADTLVLAVGVATITTLCIVIVEVSNSRVCRWAVDNPSYVVLLVFMSVSVAATYVFLIWPFIMIAAGVFWTRQVWFSNRRRAYHILTFAFVWHFVAGLIGGVPPATNIVVSSAFLLWFLVTAALPTLFIAVLLTLRKRVGR